MFVCSNGQIGNWCSMDAKEFGKWNVFQKVIADVMVWTGGCYLPSVSSCTAIMLLYLETIPSTLRCSSVDKLVLPVDT